MNEDSTGLGSQLMKSAITLTTGRNTDPDAYNQVNECNGDITTTICLTAVEDSRPGSKMLPVAGGP